MKTDLASSILLALAGGVIAFLICNVAFGEIEPVTFKTVDDNVEPTVVMPDKEIFNYKALNPTVEVYIGNCDEFNEYGECLDSGA